MGLDMYLRAVKPTALRNPTAEVDLERVADSPAEELGYWRKFNALHGWMEDRYLALGGKDSSFNCSSLRLKSEDLDDLEDALDSNGTTLTPREGFFFGEQTIYPQDVEDTRKFIVKAREALARGDVVYYFAWY